LKKIHLLITFGIILIIVGAAFYLLSIPELSFNSQSVMDENYSQGTNSSSNVYIASEFHDFINLTGRTDATFSGIINIEQCCPVFYVFDDQSFNYWKQHNFSGALPLVTITAVGNSTFNIPIRQEGWYVEVIQNGPPAISKTVDVETTLSYMPSFRLYFAYIGLATSILGLGCLLVGVIHLRRVQPDSKATELNHRPN